MEQGPHEEKIIRECMRTGRPLPPKIENAPKLEMGLDVYFQAFIDLQYDRGGMGEGPIMWTAIEMYAQAHGFIDDQKDALHYHVRALDMAWLKHQGDKRDRERSAQAIARKGRSR